MNYSFEDFLIYKNILSQKDKILIRIVSDSMAPFISIDEILEIRPLSTDLKRFDILVFWQNDKLICHFLWKAHIDNEYFFFKSLKYPRQSDDSIDKRFLLGRVSHKKLNFYYKLKIFLFNIL